MSLVVSLRIPDGIVLAADSLSTQTSAMQIMADLQATCPECNKQFPIKEFKLPPVPFASSSRSFAQKITSLRKSDCGYHFGIATFGFGIINGKTIYYHLRLINDDKAFSGLKECANYIAEYFSEQLRQQFKDVDQMPEDAFPLGFQVVGYEDKISKTYLLNLGKKNRITILDKVGCTFGGEGFLVNKMWELKKEIPDIGINYHSLSLQDAVDLAEYYITATAQLQRFSNRHPTVGGDVDIALITSYSGFKWIKCKEMTKILEKDKEKEG